MPAGTTSLTVLSSFGTPASPTWDEQASDVTPGNSFPNAKGVQLYARNTTPTPIDLVFEADRFGAEVEVLRVSIPGSATAGGVKVLGPFPPDEFNEHGTTEAAANGSVFVRQLTGGDGDVVLSPFPLNMTLLAPSLGGGYPSTLRYFRENVFGLEGSFFEPFVADNIEWEGVEVIAEPFDFSAPDVTTTETFTNDWT